MVYACVLLFVTCAWSVFFYHEKDQEKLKRKQHRAEQRKQRNAALNRDKDSRLDFIPHITIETGTGFFFADNTFTNFLFLDYKFDTSLKEGLRFHANHIVSFDLQGGLKKTISEGTVISQSKAKGGLSRAAIGAATFGGAGAVVGAATSKRVSTATTQETHKEVVGQGTLRIATTSPEVPIISLSVNRDQGSDLSIRLQRLLALRQQAA